MYFAIYFFYSVLPILDIIRIRVIFDVIICVNPLSANPTKWANTLKQFVGNLPTNCLSVFDHFSWVGS